MDYMEEFGEDAVSMDKTPELCGRTITGLLEISWTKFAGGQLRDWCISSPFFKNVSYLLSTRTITGGLE